MSTDTLTLGQQIREARLARKLSLAQLGRKAGVDKSTVHGWERDKNIPQAPNLVKAARALGMPPNPWLTLAGYLDEDGDWQAPRNAAKGDDAPSSIAYSSRTSVRELPPDPLEAGKLLLEQAPEQIVIATYMLLAGAADDKRGLWQRRILAAWEATTRVLEAATLDEAATPADILALRFQFFWRELFGEPPPGG